MEKFKIDIYLKETGMPFPKIVTLNIQERNEIINSLLNLINSNRESVELFIGVENKLAYNDYNIDYTYNLGIILRDFNFEIGEFLFVIWDKNNIDKINTVDLIELWNYIWYGDSDEAIILYDKEKGKVLLITHYGRIFYKVP